MLLRTPVKDCAEHGIPAPNFGLVLRVVADGHLENHLQSPEEVSEVGTVCPEHIPTKERQHDDTEGEDDEEVVCGSPWW